MWPGGHISENPAPYTPPLQIVSMISKEKKKDKKRVLKKFSGVFWCSLFPVPAVPSSATSPFHHQGTLPCALPKFVPGSHFPPPPKEKRGWWGGNGKGKGFLWTNSTNCKVLITSSKLKIGFFQAQLFFFFQANLCCLLQSEGGWYFDYDPHFEQGETAESVGEGLLGPLQLEDEVEISGIVVEVGDNGGGMIDLTISGIGVEAWGKDDLAVWVFCLGWFGTSFVFRGVVETAWEWWGGSFWGPALIIGGGGWWAGSLGASWVALGTAFGAEGETEGMRDGVVFKVTEKMGEMVESGGEEEWWQA